MKAELAEPAGVVTPSALAEESFLRDIPISFRTRVIVWLMKLVMRPMLSRMINANYHKIAKIQLRVASMRCPDTAGLKLDYRILGKVPGHTLGTLDDPRKPVVLWLHGGAFILPAAPGAHLVMIARLSRDLGADAFVPDYRLAPFNRFPAALDDCENAYRVLLDRGFSPSRIVLGGDSAGGNLALGVLQRIRKAGLPMPACALPVSPVTEMGRVHGPPSRFRKAKGDPILPIAALQRVDELYAGDWDAADPELSPLYADCTGFPPMYFLASDNEVLMDDTVLLAHRAREAGVQVRCDVWPLLPHAFPLFEMLFPEVAAARKDMAEFARRYLAR
ncbi:MAG TPA: alpha/beta hydrolase [Nevskiaceae bacterium]|nr:alpha/beta hydrolase [Nevskiaceae bacterium]